MTIMQHRLISLALTVAAAAGGTLATSAHAAVITARFSGVVQSQVDSGYAAGDAVSGSFSWDTGSAGFQSFTVGNRAIGAGYTSEATLTPDNYSAIFQAQISPVGGGGSVNETFTLDLEGLLPWFSPSATDAVPLLTSSTLQTNLDSASSTFSFYVADAAGTNVHRLVASLAQVSAVPEPASGALVLVACAAGLMARRSRRGH